MFNQSLCIPSQRFTVKNIAMISSSIDQLYSSALVFASGQSLVKKTFKSHRLPEIGVKSKMESAWSAELQPINIYSNYGKASPVGNPVVALSGDNGLLASSYHDG